MAGSYVGIMLLHIGAQCRQPCSRLCLSRQAARAPQPQVLMIDPDTEEPIKFEAI